jgi:hypothetical protein
MMMSPRIKRPSNSITMARRAIWRSTTERGWLTKKPSRDGLNNGLMSQSIQRRKSQPFMHLWPWHKQINPVHLLGSSIQVHHVISPTNKDWLTAYTSCSSKDSVIFGGGEEYTVVGKGNVQISFGGKMLIFLNVYYVPGMELNLLLISQIIDQELLDLRIQDLEYLN